jgi:hypothetical protein
VSRAPSRREDWGTAVRRTVHNFRARRVCRADSESGAIIVLALVYILIVSLTVGALITWVMNDLTNTTNFQHSSSLRYAATSATDAAIQSIRYDPIPTTTPTQGTATPVSYCWSPFTVVNGSDVSELSLDGYTVGVWCSTTEYLASSDTRDVMLYACQVDQESTGAACKSDPFLTAEVAVDDYPAGGGPTFTEQCNQAGDSCGAGTTLENWVWGISTSSFVAASPQTVAFYNSSYTTTITSATVTYGSGAYQLFARGSGGGSITYGSLSSSVCTVNAAGTVTLVGTGTCSLTADAAVTPGYADSGPVTFSLTIVAAPTTASVVSSLNPSTIGQQVTYTATVTVNSPSTGTPTGSVEFFDGGSAISGCASETLSGTSTDTATCAVTYAASGNNTITAEYLGSTVFAESALSSSITQTVNNLSYSGGSNGQSLTNTAEYYVINQNQLGTSNSTSDKYTPGVTTTLTNLSVTISSTSSTSNTLTVDTVTGSTVATTALTCTVAGNSFQTTCSTSGSVAISSTQSIEIVGTGSRSVTWTVTYAQP